MPAALDLAAAAADRQGPLYPEENTLSISISHPHFMTPCAVAQIQNPGPDGQFE